MTRCKAFLFFLILGLLWLAPVLWHQAAAQGVPVHDRMTPEALSQPNVLPPPGAQSEPNLPPPLATLVQQGGQVRYLGRELGMDGWIAVRNGHVEYFYAPPG